MVYVILVRVDSGERGGLETAGDEERLFKMWILDCSPTCFATSGFFK